MRSMLIVSSLAVLSGCGECCRNIRENDYVSNSGRVEALSADTWAKSEWIAVKGEIGAPAAREMSASGTSRFMREITNAKVVKSAKWMTTALGVYELYVNGKIIGDDFLKPGFTHVKHTRRSFTYDITRYINRDAGAKNILASDVSAGWWRDKIVNYHGKKSAFRAVLELVYEDGSKELIGTDDETWTGVVGGPVLRAAIFDGELYDARISPPVLAEGAAAFGCEVSTEFSGEILPSDGGEVLLRRDLALKPIEMYVWSKVEAADKAKEIFGKVVKDREYKDGDIIELAEGETLIVDFGQNCAGVVEYKFEADEGTTLTMLPGEMLNDRNGERARGNDGPGGSLYRENLRIPNEGMRNVYTFGKRAQTPIVYHPRFTFFGYRYASLTATGKVKIHSLRSIPVTSISKEMERGKLVTGNKDVNKLISNIYWGQLSNYLSVPTDCPQRNERLGWSNDTLVFCEAGMYNADTSKFFDKWMRDLCDSRDEEGGFPSVAPFAQYGNETFNLGWADVGVFVPYRVWKHLGHKRIIEENYEAMKKFVKKIDEIKYNMEGKRWIYADWVSYERYCSSGNHFGGWSKAPEPTKYRLYLAANYWLMDARMMVEVAEALGKTEDAKWFAESEKRAMNYIRENFVEEDGLLSKVFRDMQTPSLYALKNGIVTGDAAEKTKEMLLKNIREHGECLQTGFLGTYIIMDTLSEHGMTDVAYTLLLQHKNPSWLYSVDQGATTIWERWNSYTLDKGFGPVGMNSFNHYAFGAVLGWMYKTMAGIMTDPATPGFKNIILAPQPDKRMGFVEAEYKIPSGGVVKSAWRYERDTFTWEFTIPEGSTALVKVPGESESKTYEAGTYIIKK